MRTEVSALVVPILTLFVGPSTAQEVVTHKSKAVSVTLPDGWKVQSKYTKMKDLAETRENHRILSFAATAPGMRRSVAIDVDVVNSGAHRIRPDWQRGRIFYNSYQGVSSVEAGDDPVLHLIAQITKPSKSVLALTYTRATGRTVKLMVRCSASQWDEVKPALFAMTKSLKLKLPPWPVRPRGRTEKLSKGVLFSSTKEIKKPAMREVQKCTLDVQKGMVEIHGPIGRPKDDPLRLYINELMADHKMIAASQALQPVVTEVTYHRLFTVPLEARGTKQRGEFVQGLVDTMLTDLYGLIESLWFITGERMVAAERDATKRKLPTVRKVMLENVTISMKFDELTSHRKVPAADYYGQCLAYVAMFHAGPKEYRAAFQAFLKELRATGDASASAKKHLHSLDQTKLQADVRTYVKKLRPIRVKAR